MMAKRSLWRDVLFSTAMMAISAAPALAQTSTERLDQAKPPQADKLDQVHPAPPSTGEDRAGTPRDDQNVAPGQPEQLSRTPGGVISPPPTGDRNVVPSPNAGPNAMPVIPPPGSSGNNPQVQPK
jgi:hypothetical protein